ncbi:MAG TPA: antibiotic biosynthesis monooxygenase family protein [Polyangiaceae bacterium]|nr:antibiotic biosynthesis monooxygenase family protein [Polyangiaceae bacterium]
MGSFSVKPGAADALRSTYNEQALPKVRSQPGNLGCVLLEPESPAEEHVVLTLWRDRAAAEAYEASGTAAEVVGLVRAHFAGPPALRSYSSASERGLPGA